MSEEMVPLDLIEEELQHTVGSTDRVLVVLDDKKEERLMVLHLPLNEKMQCKQLNTL